MNHLGPSWGDFGPVLGRILEPKIGSFLVIFGVMFWTQFWALFEQLLGQFRGPILGPDWPRKAPRWDKEGHRELQRPKKLQLQKHGKQLVFQGFWGPEASQESLRRPKKAPKRHLKSSKTQQKTESKNGPQNYQILDQFLDDFGVHFEYKNCSKREPKMGQLLEAILEASWACLRAVLGSRVRARREQRSGPEPGRGKGRAAKLIYSAYLAYLAA